MTVTIADRAGGLRRRLDRGRSASRPGLSFVVTNTNDSGPGSLRQAILERRPGRRPHDHLRHPRAGGVATIVPPRPCRRSPARRPSTGLAGHLRGRRPSPPLVEVDGRASPGRPTGSSSPPSSAGSLLAGPVDLRLRRAQVDLDGRRRVVQGNYLGLRADGTVAPAPLARRPSPAADGVGARRPRAAIIGGLDAAAGQRDLGQRGPGDRVRRAAAIFGRVVGNLIGTDPTGTVARRQRGSTGSRSSAAAGRETHRAGQRDLGQRRRRHRAARAPVGNLIAGNLIGTDATGTRAAGQRRRRDLRRRRLGGRSRSAGPPPGLGNVISGNGVVGVAIQGGSTRNAGPGQPDRDRPGGRRGAVGNGIAGVLISDSPGNVVGPGNLSRATARLSRAPGSGSTGRARPATWSSATGSGPTSTASRAIGNALDRRPDQRGVGQHDRRDRRSGRQPDLGQHRRSA